LLRRRRLFAIGGLYSRPLNEAGTAVMSIEAFAAPGQFWRGNLHTHSTLSDGDLSPESVCGLYRDAGYDFLCLSDHFVARYKFPVADTRPFRTNRFTTILGAEIHAPANSHGELWHMLAVGLPEDFAPTGETESGVELSLRARAAGAFVGIAHPQWSSLSIEDGRSMLGAAHSVEIYNSSCDVECARADGTYLLDALLNEGNRLSAYAADDAHFRIDDAFRGWVMVKAEANDPSQLVEALKRGEYYSSQGPVFHDVAVEGNEIRLHTSPSANFALVGRGSRSLHVKPVKEATVMSLPTEKFAGDWCRAVVEDRDGKRAWTNPIWLS
jgi:hypothetical protein